MTDTAHRTDFKFLGQIYVNIYIHIFLPVVQWGVTNEATITHSVRFNPIQFSTIQFNSIQFSSVEIVQINSNSKTN